MIFNDSEIEELIKAGIFVDKREYSTDELWAIINKTNRKIISKELYDNIWYNVFGPPTSIRWATPAQRKMWPPEIKKDDIVECPRCKGKPRIMKDDNEEEYYKCEICKYVFYIIQVEILPLYKNPENEESLKSLNMLCVRLVFCLYAEDAGLFGKHGMFHDYLSKFSAEDLRKALIDLFVVLDTKEQERDPYMKQELAQFPYVNGGLFAKEDIEIPMLNDKVRDLLLTRASEDFDWRKMTESECVAELMKMYQKLIGKENS